MAAPGGVGGRAVWLLVAVLWAGSAFGGSVALTLAALVFLLK
ncbi:hypothetical protein ACFVVL_03245 [Kitasatospora sp. NPDC058115]